MIEFYKKNFSLSDVFHKLEKEFEKKPSIDKASELANLAVTGNYNVYNSKILEEYYKSISEKEIVINKKNTLPHKNSTLHILSQAYPIGGHTRIVERWIQLSDENEKNDIVLTNQPENETPLYLKSETHSKNCHIFNLDINTSIINRAKKLRELCEKYEYIILHHHPNDPIPLIALGSHSFSRPIICFNHSGHTFWLGSSIVTLSIEINKVQEYLSHKIRGINKTLLVNMPFSKKKESDSIYDLRSELNIPSNGIIILSMASEYKTNPLNDLNFPKMIDKLISRNENLYYIGIGISNKNIFFKKIKNRNRVFLLGKISFDKINSYLTSADIFLDTFPYNSMLSVNDAISIGKLPCVILKTPLGHMPYITENNFSSNTINEYIIKVQDLINSKSLRLNLSKSLFEKASYYCKDETFKEKIKLSKMMALSSNSEYLDNKILDKETTEMTNYLYDLNMNKKLRNIINLKFIKYMKYKIKKSYIYKIKFFNNFYYIIRRRH